MRISSFVAIGTLAVGITFSVGLISAFAQGIAGDAPMGADNISLGCGLN